MNKLRCVLDNRGSTVQTESNYFSCDRVKVMRSSSVGNYLTSTPVVSTKDK